MHPNCTYSQTVTWNLPMNELRLNYICSQITVSGFPLMNCIKNVHYSDVAWILWRPRWLSVQQLVPTNTKIPHYWPLWMTSTGDWWIPLTKGKWRGKVFHAMTSSVGTVFQVKWSVIGTFLSAAGWPMFACLIVFHTLYTVGQIVTNLWLSAWTTDALTNSTYQAPSQTHFRLGIYGALGFGQGIVFSWKNMLGFCQNPNIFFQENLNDSNCVEV